MSPTPWITLRPSSSEHCLIIWHWRNDPDTRRASFNEDEVLLDEHTSWLQKSLNSNDCKIYIVQVGEAAAGVVRLDISEREATVNINIAPEWRGKGVGPAALRTLASEAFGSLGLSRLVARIKADNHTSRTVFHRVGFTVVSEGDPVIMTLIRRVRVVAAIQARMGSTRLPGKVLRPIAGKPMIGWIAERLRACREVDEIVVSTTVETSDDAIIKFAREIRVSFVRGSERDLIQRLLLAAHEQGADAIVRITADCPFVEPNVVDQLVRVFREKASHVDFITNNDPPSLPHGLDAEVVPTATLERLDKEVRDPYYREWIPLYVKAHRDRFRIVNVRHPENLSWHRWTVDYPEDLEFASRVFEMLGSQTPVFSMDDVLRLLHAHPEIMKINAIHVERG